MPVEPKNLRLRRKYPAIGRKRLVRLLAAVGYSGASPACTFVNRTSVNLASFAELAVRLVNSAHGDAGADPLRSTEAFRELIADRPFFAAPVTRSDIDQLRLLRSELAAIFVGASAQDGAAVAARLNALLITHPLHPVMTSHDGERWHLHLDESGSVADRYASAAVSGLAMIVTQVGLHKLGVCSIAACDRVFIDGSSNKSRRYCAMHASRSNVTQWRSQPEAVESRDSRAAS